MRHRRFVGFVAPLSFVCAIWACGKSDGQTGAGTFDASVPPVDATMADSAPNDHAAPALDGAPDANVVSRNDAAAKERASGIFCLPQGDNADRRFDDLATHPCWTNHNVVGLALRSNWDIIQTSESTYDWTFFDTAIALAAKYGKKVSFDIDAGESTPQWVLDAIGDAGIFNGTSSGGNATIFPYPWNPTYLEKWLAFIAAFGAKYDGNPFVAYVGISGMGRQGETVEADTDQGVSAYNAAASASNDDAGSLDAAVAAWTMLGGDPSSTGDARWLQASKVITAAYASAFPTTPFIVAMGHPTDDDAGAAAISYFVSDSETRYASRFGAKSCALVAGYDSPFSTSTIAHLTEAGAPSGYQMFLPYSLCSEDGLPPMKTCSLVLQDMDAGDAAFGFQNCAFNAPDAGQCPEGTSGHADGTVGPAIATGIALHAQFLEVYAADCNDMRNNGVIASGNAALLDAFPEP